MDENLKLQRIKLIEDNVAAMLTIWKDLDNSEFVNDSTKVQIVTGLPFAFMNSVTNVNFLDNDTDQQLDEIIALFENRKVPVLWWIGPNSTPKNLDTFLEKREFRKVDEPPGMYMDLNNLDLSSLNSSNLRIELVKNLKQIEDWVNVFSAGMGTPENRREHLLKSQTILKEKEDYIGFIGYSNDEPVTISALILDDNVAGVYFVITKTEQRGKGFGTLITLAALKEARDQGYHQAILQSSAMGYNIYKRIGFEEYCKFKWYYKKFD
ncbi:MAG: GNAT family N-acetyltransferase [Asgard group archaeon]|nr:GNAT family N-acetyltransferase [Asgard group archaeon]